MKILSCEPYKMYCPSTGEVIIDMETWEINHDAKAFIAYWHGEVLEDPEIREPQLQHAWEKYFQEWEDNDYVGMDIWELVEKFLSDYENPDWIVYECTFEGMACGPITRTVYYVVKADTIIEEDPDLDEEEDEEASDD